MAYKTIKIGELELTADELRDLANAMDNPDRLLPFECKNITEYAERLGLK